MKVTNVKSLWPEKQGFSLERKNTGNQYIFVHFLSPISAIQNGREEKIKSGACILYSKYSHQQFSAPDAPLVHNWFHLTGNLNKLLSKYHLEENKFYYPANSEIITDIIQNIEIEFMLRNKYWDNLCEIYCEELFAKISRNLNQETSLSIDNQWKETLVNLRSKIHMNYNEDWSVKKMADEIGLSESRFYTVYKHIFGISPQKDLQNMRIEHAKQMLINNTANVEEISESVGYKSVYHFIRQFKSVCGVSPGKYTSLFE